MPTSEEKYAPPTSEELNVPPGRPCPDPRVVDLDSIVLCSICNLYVRRDQYEHHKQTDRHWEHKRKQLLAEGGGDPSLPGLGLHYE